MNPLRIGTRGSRLALWQAHHVAEHLLPRIAPRPVQLVEIQTAGDQDRSAPLAQIGGQGVFTKEIQRALLDGRVDVAVHSLKDLPTLPVEGLVLAAVPPRGPCGDVFLSVRHGSFDSLPAGARLASGSQRRRAQAWHRRPDLQLVDIRGNVETRLRRLQELDLDGLILARAGLERLGLADQITEALEWLVPAVGQGALGLECRAADPETLQLLQTLDDPPSRRAVQAERAMLLALGGGCQVPIGGHAEVAGERLRLRGVVLSADGRRRIAAVIEGPSHLAEPLGRQLAEQLRTQGADELLHL